MLYLMRDVEVQVFFCMQLKKKHTISNIFLGTSEKRNTLRRGKNKAALSQYRYRFKSVKTSDII